MKHNLILGLQSQRSIRLVIVKHVTIRLKCGSGCGTQRMRNGCGDKMRNGYGDKMRNGYGDKMRNGYGDKMRNGYGDKMRHFNEFFCLIFTFLCL